MTSRSTARRLLLRIAIGCALAVAGISAPIVVGALTPAIAQTSDDMAAALDAYGHWMRDPRYGDVWTPDGVPADWRPYEYGHWVYTDDWGWYWVSDDQEDDWGWVVYHYGRWIHDRGSWFWVPGDDWAPAWVDWRYGGDDIGWAPMPPDDLVDAYDDDAEYWSFVPLRYIGEPGLRRYYVPRDRRTVIFRETRTINRPVHLEGRRVWVNPGLAPGFITGRTHVALHAYNVRPRVFGATAGVQGAVTIRRDQLRNKGDIRRVAPVTIQRTTTAITPVTGAPPKPLGKGERGQLGSHPPRAAQGGTPQPQLQQQQQQQTPPSGGPPHPGPAPVIKPANPTVVPRQPPATPQTPERREIHPPAGNAPAGGNPPVVHPNSPLPPPPPKQPAPPPPRSATPPPPPAVHAPPPPVVHAPPPPVVHAPPPPPPPAVHAPPPAAKPAAPPRPAPKPGEKPPEAPK